MTATATKLPPMPAETQVFDGVWELTWMGAEWVISRRLVRGKRGFKVHRDRKPVGFVATVAMARAFIRRLVEKEQH